MYFFSRRRPDLRHRPSSSRSTSGSCRGRVEEGSAASTSACPTSPTRSRASTPASSHVQDPVTTAASWASRASISAKSVDFYPLGPPRRSSFRSRPTARRLRPAPGDRQLRVLDLRSREPQARRRRPSSRAGRAWGSRPARTARCSTSTTPATRSISTTRRPIKYLRTIKLDADMTTDLFVFRRRRRNRRTCERRGDLRSRPAARARLRRPVLAAPGAGARAERSSARRCRCTCR